MNLGTFLGLLSLAAASALSGCHEQPPPNCWESRYPFEAFPAPPGAEPYLFACRAQGGAPGVGVRADGTVALLESGADTNGAATEWRERPTDTGPPHVVAPAELAAKHQQVQKLPAMPWPWDRTLQDELTCFARSAPGTNTVMPLSAGTRPVPEAAQPLVQWLRGLKAGS